MRGLKPVAGVYYECRAIVASFTDAWIETKSRILSLLRARVASFTDAWIETVFVCHV